MFNVNTNMSLLDDENILMSDVKSDIHPVNMLKCFINYSVRYDKLNVSYESNELQEALNNIYDCRNNEKLMWCPHWSGVFKLIYRISTFDTITICTFVFSDCDPIKHRPFSVIMQVNESIYDRSNYIPITEIKEEIMWKLSTIDPTEFKICFQHAF
jgi:hypothetical protein